MAVRALGNGCHPATAASNCAFALAPAPAPVLAPAPASALDSAFGSTAEGAADGDRVELAGDRVELESLPSPVSIPSIATSPFAGAREQRWASAAVDRTALSATAEGRESELARLRYIQYKVRGMRCKV